MERDEESGLSYHAARYLAPWLGRWISCDLAGQIDGNNLYVYASSNPSRFVDQSGLEGESSDVATRAAAHRKEHGGRSFLIVEKFEEQVRRNLPKEKTPTTAREKSVDVDIVTPEHDRAVANLFNAAIDAAAANAKEKGTTPTEFELIKSAQEEFMGIYRNKDSSTSQNLALRDADRYLTGLLQFWRKHFGNSPGPTKSSLTVFWGDLASGDYKNDKKISFRAHPKPDEPNAKSSLDQTPLPGSAPGGHFWSWLGGQHLLNRGHPDDPGKASSLYLTYEDVQKGRTDMAEADKAARMQWELLNRTPMR